jgi:hypothetical protein
MLPVGGKISGLGAPFIAAEGSDFTGETEFPESSVTGAHAAANTTKPAAHPYFMGPISTLRQPCQAHRAQKIDPMLHQNPGLAKIFAANRILLNPNFNGLRTAWWNQTPPIPWHTTQTAA